MEITQIKRFITYPDKIVPFCYFLTGLLDTDLKFSPEDQRDRGPDL